MTVYALDSSATPVAHFRLNGAPYDPATVTLTIHKPGTPVPVVKIKADMLNDSPGDYAYDLAFDQRGTWRVRWLGVGTYVDVQGRTRQYLQPITQVFRVYL